MEKNQENSDMSVQDECKKKCPDPPPFPIKVPDDPSCPDYEEIPDNIKEVIDFKLESAKQSADGAHEDAQTKAEDTKAQAKTLYDAAIRKYNDALRRLSIGVETAKKQLYLDYNKCHADIIPQKCPSPNDPPPPCDKEAICVTQLKQNIAKKDTEFQKKIQKIDQEMSAAGWAWKKAQEDYDSELCIADAVKNEAYLAAELEWRKELSKALEEL